tara:strand:- start:51 stop:1127 length:1077 start_codon:yes stop_codon:yes gene_type:complete
MNYFGIDVHSTYHKVVGLTADGEPLEFDIPNTREGREELQELMLQHKPCAVAMEACSGAYKIYDLLQPVVQRIQLLHPADLKEMFGKKSRKNDRIDAAMCCRAAKYEMEGIWVPDEETRQRRALSARRVSITQKRTASKNSVKSAFREYHIQLAENPWSDKGMKVLRERLKKLPATVALGVELELNHIEVYNRSIEQLDHRMAELAWGNEQIELLMSVPGISYYSAFVIMAEVGDIRRFESAKQLTAYAGLCPSFNQSGKKQTRHGPITRKGRSRLRWITVECAHVGARYAPKLQRLKWRLKKRGKHGNIATVAVGRKLLELCYHILKSGKPYSESIPEKHEAKLRKLEGKAKVREAA